MKFPPVDQQHCGNCRYYRSGGGMPGMWRCHRNPPQIGPRGTEWPPVGTSDWCGLWVEMEVSDG